MLTVWVFPARKFVRMAAISSLRYLVKTSRRRTLGKTSQLVFRPVVQQPAQPDKGVFKEVEAMANRWVEVGALTPDAAQKKLDDLMKFLKQQKVPNAPKELKITAKAPAEGKTSVEQQKNRDKMVKVLLAPAIG